MSIAPKNNIAEPMQSMAGTVASKRAPRKSVRKANGNGDTQPWGTQSIHRAITILREIAARSQMGLRLADIADALALERPTAHRIVKGLVAQGMVAQDPVTKRYRLGHVVYELGLAATPHYNLKEICQPALHRLAEKSGDSVFLVARSGLDAVCIDRIEGSYPIQTRTLNIGGRRPLGIGAGSVALLMAMTPAEIDHAINANAARFATFSQLTPDRLRKALKLSTETGYAINIEDVLPGVTAIGMAIRPPQGNRVPYGRGTPGGNGTSVGQGNSPTGKTAGS
jgi:DNA-binding IclR family transcriptional regulator